MADRVRQQWTGSGTGEMTLGSAVTTFRAFPDSFDGQEISYLIQHMGEGVTEVEAGKGTYTLSTTSLSRTEVRFSTNSDNLVDFSSGTKHVSLVPLYDDFVRASDLGEMAEVDFAAGNRMYWGLVELDATSGNVTFDGSNAAFVIRVHGTPGTARNLTVTPAPTADFPSRSVVVINNSNADVNFINHAAATIATLAASTWRSFDWNANAWTAGAVFPGGSGSGITAFAEDVAPVDVTTGATLTAASHGELYVSGSTLRRRKVRLRHASNQATAVSVTVEDGLIQQIAMTQASDQTGLVTISRTTSATINGATSVTLAGPGASALLIPGPTNVYHLEGQTGEAVDFIDVVVSRPELKDYAETSTSPTNSAGTVVLDYTLGNAFQHTLTANITTLTLSNPPASGKLGSIVLKITQDATPRTIAWPASVDWAGGVAPTLSTGSGDVDIVTLITWDAGTRWFGVVGGQDFS